MLSLSLSLSLWLSLLFYCFPSQPTTQMPQRQHGLKVSVFTVHVLTLSRTFIQEHTLFKKRSACHRPLAGSRQDRIIIALRHRKKKTGHFLSLSLHNPFSTAMLSLSVWSHMSYLDLLLCVKLKGIRDILTGFIISLYLSRAALCFNLCYWETCSFHVHCMMNTSKKAPRSHKIIFVLERFTFLGHAPCFFFWYHGKI